MNHSKNKLAVWDVYKGKALHKYVNDESNVVPIYDASISGDGTTATFVDAGGHVSILGVESRDPVKWAPPREQFFNTDYM